MRGLQVARFPSREDLEESDVLGQDTPKPNLPDRTVSILVGTQHYRCTVTLEQYQGQSA
jgi:hypothetical protein